LANPYFGDGCRANAFVLTIDPQAQRATITQVDVSAPGVNASLQRAFHGAAIVGDDGLVAGGWVLGNAAAALTPTGSIITYTDRLAAGTFEIDRLPESAARLGHVVTHTRDGTILLAGGLKQLGENRLLPTNLAEVYSPPMGNITCEASTDATP